MSIKNGSLVRCIEAEPIKKTNLEKDRLYIVTDVDMRLGQLSVMNLMGDRIHWFGSKGSIRYDRKRFKVINVPESDASLIAGIKLR